MCIESIWYDKHWSRHKICRYEHTKQGLCHQRVKILTEDTNNKQRKIPIMVSTMKD